jgi:hypothetical protein
MTSPSTETIPLPREPGVRPAFAIRSRDSLFIVLLAAILASLGAVPMADHTTHRVLEMVQPIPWSQALLPFWNPPPMEAWAIRPGSVILIKALLTTGQISGIPQPPLLAFCAFCGLSLFGLAARAWLCVTGLRTVALPATLSCMLLSPTLFSAWLLVEFDTLGAGLVLTGSTLLLKRGPLGWRSLAAVLFVIMALLLKESTALVQFAFLIAGASILELHHRTERARRHWLILAIGVLCWSVLVALTLEDKGSLVGRTHWSSRIPILEHNQAQIVYLTTIPGCTLIGLRCLNRWIRAEAVRALTPWLAVIGLAALPPVIYYSHYEAVYFSPRWVPAALGLLVLVSLLDGLLQRGKSAIERLPQAVILLALFIFGAAVILASNPREDLASRLFLALAPTLHGIAWLTLHQLWSSAGSHRWKQAPVAALGLSMAWTPLASTWNTTHQWRAQQAVDYSAREALVEQDLGDSKLIFNHVSTWLGTPELEALGWTPDSGKPTRLVKTPAWLRHDELPPMDWGLGLDDLEHDYLTGTPIWLYWLAPRSEMSDEVNAALIGDLSWTRRPMGIFTPINHAEGSSAAAEARRRDLPIHNLAEDMRMTTWSSQTPPLQALAETRGQRLHHQEAHYKQLPILLPDIGQRIARGIPWLEDYRIEASIFYLFKEQTPL